jgi:DNA (cytosine-5)-methyltransferase 1
VLNGLDLFSGIGGLTIALEPWVRTVAYCENDRYAQAVLLSRMRDHSICRAPIWDDVRTLRGDMLAGGVDFICGGFPCQDISVAGNGAGLGGSRSGLFFEIIRLTRELRPRFVFLENVPAITLRGLDRVLLEFTALGYDCRWTIVSATEMGAPHIRERWFLLSNSKDDRIRWGQQFKECRKGERDVADASGDRRVQGGARSEAWGRQTDSESGCASLDNPMRGRHGPQEREVCSGRSRPEYAGWWATEPDVGRVAHGVPLRVDRLRGLGNAVVPAQAREAFRRLAGLQ